MFPPHKKRRIDSQASSSTDPDFHLTVDEVFTMKYTAQLKLLNTWDSLESKYYRDLADDDIIDLARKRIVQDKGIGDFRELEGDNAEDEDEIEGEGEGEVEEEVEDDDVEEAEEEEEAERTGLEDDPASFNDLDGIYTLQDVDSSNSESPAARVARLGLPRIKHVTDDEDLASFDQKENERRQREGDYDQKLDAMVKELPATPANAGADRGADLLVRKTSTPRPNVGLQGIDGDSAYARGGRPSTRQAALETWPQKIIDIICGSEEASAQWAQVFKTPEFVSLTMPIKILIIKSSMTSVFRRLIST